MLKDLHSKQNRTGSKREHLIKQYVEHIDLIIQVHIYMTIILQCYYGSIVDAIALTGFVA